MHASTLINNHDVSNTFCCWTIELILLIDYINDVHFHKHYVNYILHYHLFFDLSNFKKDINDQHLINAVYGDL